MRSSDVATMLVASLADASRSSNVGWHTGIVRSWDDLTGLNTVEIGGNTFTNVLVLATGAVQAFVPNDVVMVLRLGTQYFIVGKVRAPGAGAGERIASDRVAQSVLLSPTGGAYVDISGSPGPEVTVYIGSQRRALVVHSCEVYVSGVINIAEQGQVHQGVEISGATTRPPASAVTNAFLQGPAGVSSSASATTFVTSVDGLEQGQNTFTCKYRGEVDGNQTLQVNNRVLTVIPF